MKTREVRTRRVLWRYSYLPCFLSTKTKLLVELAAPADHLVARAWTTPPRAVAVEVWPGLKPARAVLLITPRGPGACRITDLSISGRVLRKAR